MLSCSVVITTWNSAQTIRRCLESLMPYVNNGYIKEVLVVDGHSSDKTVEIIHSFPVQFFYEEGTEVYEKSIIRSHYSKYHALDMGWRKATAELVMFLDSDAYLGDNFFPQAWDFFKNDKLGILGCSSRAWPTGAFWRTIGEMWQFHSRRIAALQSSSPNIFENLYQRVAWFGAKYVLTSGPCYIARRTCVQAIGGHDILGDVGLCLHIMEKGWDSHWWTESPVYHMTVQNLKELWRQRYAWGLDGAFRPDGRWRKTPFLLLRVAGAAGLGVFLSARFRNPRHLLVLPISELGHLYGYIAGKIARARGKT